MLGQDKLRLLGNINRRAIPALARAHAEILHPSRDWTERCQEFVRTMLDTGADLDGDGGTALQAWEAVDPAHRHGWLHPPAGVPYFWGGGVGHTALCDGLGNVFSTDIKRPGHVDLVPLGLIASKWGKKPLGWTEVDNDVVVYTRGLKL